MTNTTANQKGPRMTQYRTVTSAEDVTAEILTAAENAYDGWYANADRIDWTDLLDRIDGAQLDDGSTLDLGGDMLSPAIKRITAHIREYRRR